MLIDDTPERSVTLPYASPSPTSAADAPGRRATKIGRGWKIAAGMLVLLIALVAWLAITAPLSKSLQPITAPSLTLVSAEGKPIARRGAVLDRAVAVSELPAHVPGAFLAIEDRRFYSHFGIDPRGILRAALHNLRAGAVVEGASTISQQLAKLAFLSPDRTIGRKLQEAILAIWLEAWLTKDEILSRYLSSVYFGDNVYGLRAAASHYFSRKPEDLTIEQAALLAGLVKAPSRLAPTSNLAGARKRARLVIGAMVEAGMLDERVARKLPEVRLKPGPAKAVPTGSYFADWVFPHAEARAREGFGPYEIRTTLEDRLQDQATRAVRGAGLGGAQVALVAMRPDGRVVAMIGGKDYRRSPFNRAVQARRQPGSTFKLFVYLAALRAGYTPADPIEDSPVRIGGWSPQNYENRYRGTISLRQAFAVSSNVAAVRLTEAVGRDEVIRAARDLGIAGDLDEGPTLALGTSGVSLIEMVAAYAAVAADHYPVRPRGLPQPDAKPAGPGLDRPIRAMLVELLWASANEGSGRAATLPATTFGKMGTFGKTGTSQDNRDAYFIGFAGGLVTGVWVGHDDDSPMGGVQGGGLPARIWRDFMEQALSDGVTRSAARPRMDDAPATLAPAQSGSATIDIDILADPDAPTNSILTPAEPVILPEVADDGPPEAPRVPENAPAPVDPPTIVRPPPAVPTPVPQAAAAPRATHR